MSTKAAIPRHKLQLAKVDKRVFGAFIEHLGRAIYTGLYQPDILADQDGFRMLLAGQELGVR